MDQNEWGQGRKTYEFLQRMGYFVGYAIVGSDDEKECEICDNAQGEYTKISLDNPLPPFHPNCRCRVELNWKEVANLEIILREYWNPETGEIKRDRWGNVPTRDLVTEAVNFFLQKRGVEEKLSWEEIVYFGFEDVEGNEYGGETYDAGFLVGWRAKVLNWNIFMASRLDKYRSGEYEYLDYYDPESGMISVKSDGSVPSRQDIVDAVNFFLEKECGLEEELTWEEIAWHGFYDEDKQKVENYSSVEDLIGKTTMLDVTNVVNVDGDDSPDTLGWWLDLAREEGLKIGDRNNWEVIDVWDMWWLAGKDKLFDLKNKKYNQHKEVSEENNIFGKNPDGTREKRQAYIYQGKYVRYDHTGNILIGCMAYYAGMEVEDIIAWVDIAIYTESFGFERDDAEDQDAIWRGYEMAKTGI